MKNKIQTKKLTQLAMLIAIMFVFSVVGIGIIKIPPVSITIMHIPVIIGAITLGPLYGGILGGFFGLISMFEAMRSPNPADQIFSPFGSPNPFASLIMVFGPRIFLGIISGYLFNWLKKIFNKQNLAIGISAGVATVFHTIGVLSILSLSFKALPLKEVFMAVISFNGILELALAVILSIFISKPLITYINKK